MIVQKKMRFMYVRVFYVYFGIVVFGCKGGSQLINGPFNSCVCVQLQGIGCVDSSVVKKFFCASCLATTVNCYSAHDAFCVEMSSLCESIQLSINVLVFSN